MLIGILTDNHDIPSTETPKKLFFANGFLQIQGKGKNEGSCL